jgi:hypothetical protein
VYIWVKSYTTKLQADKEGVYSTPHKHFFLYSRLQRIAPGNKVEMAQFLRFGKQDRTSRRKAPIESGVGVEIELHPKSIRLTEQRRYQRSKSQLVNLNRRTSLPSVMSSATSLCAKRSGAS